MKTCNTTCPYCGVGCGVTAAARRARPVDPRRGAMTSHPGQCRPTLCQGHSAGSKHWCSAAGGSSTRCHAAASQTDLGPRPGTGRAAHAQSSARAIRSCRPWAFYLSGQLLTEDYYVANKLMKGFHGQRQCRHQFHASVCPPQWPATSAPSAQILVPCAYRDLETCDLSGLMVGSNAAWTHPVSLPAYRRGHVRRARSKRVVVIDPRAAPSTCDIADLHSAARPR